MLSCFENGAPRPLPRRWWAVQHTRNLISSTRSCDDLITLLQGIISYISSSDIVDTSVATDWMLVPFHRPLKLKRKKVRPVLHMQFRPIERRCWDEDIDGKYYKAICHMFICVHSDGDDPLECARYESAAQQSLSTAAFSTRETLL
jgi:hypothetical protein